MSKIRKFNRTNQQIKEGQINFLLEVVEKNLEEYKEALELKEKQLSDTKKIIISAKNSYDKTVAENKELKIYMQKIKQRFQQYQLQQQVQFLEDRKNYYGKRSLKKYKKVVYEEDPDSEQELEEEEYSAEEIEEELEIKKPRKKTGKRKNNIFDYINKDAKRYER